MISRPHYSSKVLFFPIQTLRCYFFLATTNTWLREQSNGDESQVLHFEKWLGYFQMLAVVCSPISDMIIDYSMQYFRSRKTLEPRLASLGFHAAITAIFGILYSLLIFTGIPSLQVRFNKTVVFFIILLSMPHFYCSSCTDAFALPAPLL